MVLRYPRKTKGLCNKCRRLRRLYTVTVSAFQNILYTAFYVLSMLMLSFHLSHGVSSAFQTLGLSTSKYEKIINFVGKSIAVLIPLIFASIPITLYVR